ncbi:MAG: hypothetical protein ACXWDM_10040, partial [Nocardioides sp.]
GVIAALALVGDSWGAYWFPWPLAIIGLIAFVWLSRSRDRAEQRAAPQGAPTTWETADTQVGPGQPSHTPPPAYVASRPRDPRKRGPILFWFTLLLIAFAEGVLGIIDAAGAPVADSAYAALAVGVIAAMLLVGSVIGRAGGLIALGLLASLVLGGATVADRWDGERYSYLPSSADEVAATYTMSTGELVLDLTAVGDPEELDGRTIDLSGEVGRIEVLVPRAMDVDADVRIDGPGGYEVFDREGGGFSSRVVNAHDGGRDVPALTLVADLQVGEISIVTE